MLTEKHFVVKFKSFCQSTWVEFVFFEQEKSFFLRTKKMFFQWVTSWSGEEEAEQVGFGEVDTWENHEAAGGENVFLFWETRIRNSPHTDADGRVFYALPAWGHRQNFFCLFLIIFAKIFLLLSSQMTSAVPHSVPRGSEVIFTWQWMSGHKSDSSWNFCVSSLRSKSLSGQNARIVIAFGGCLLAVDVDLCVLIASCEAFFSL